MKTARAWRDDAACRDLSPAETDRVFFSEQIDAIAERQALCAACSVRGDCQLFQAHVAAVDREAVKTNKGRFGHAARR